MPDTQHNPLPHLGFKRFSPSAKLARYVQSYWFVNSELSLSNDRSEYLHPDGGMSIIFNYSDVFQFANNNKASEFIFDGAGTATRALNLKGRLNIIGIRFHPAGASSFLSTPLNEYKNTLLNHDDVPFKQQAELYQQLSEVDSYQQKVNLIEKWLTHIVKPEAVISDVVSASVNFIQQHHGQLTISDLAKQLGFNQRRIERLFNSQVGLTAKEFAQNIRVKHARTYIKQKPNLTFAEIAHDLGYYDQAHFNHQFKQVMGISPKRYSQKSQHAKA